MKNKIHTLKRILALAMVAVLLLSNGLVATPAQAVSGSQVLRTADGSTMNAWREAFVNPAAAGVALTTENAGGVWTDKSVFPANAIPAELTDAVSLENTHLQVTDKGDNFLVALSAIASNKEITGYSTIPTDTVFILDLSSSMRTNDDRGDSAIDELAEATNRAITTLLALNHNNRVAVVLYAGNVNGSFSNANGATQVLLPMDRYTPASTVGGVGQFLDTVSMTTTNNWGQTTVEQDWAMSVHNGVRNGTGQAVTGRMDTASGTFIQDGIYEAMREMLAVEDTTIQSGVQAGATRMPIMVLMTDGEPTMANNDYNGQQNAQGVHTDLGNSNMYLTFRNDYNHRDTIAFMTQLTAAYAKKQVAAHYDHNALFYTLSYGAEVTQLDEALSVMDPARTSDALNRLWNTFLTKNGNTYSRVQVTSTQGNVLYAQNDANDPLTAADKLYVNEYFPASSDDELFAAFSSVVEEIEIQSKYYPTYVETDHDHDGYITFTDKIGGYMEVTDIKGLVIGDHYFSGATLSKGFTDEDSIFGTVNNPDPRGDELVRSVRTRLGIESLAVARQLLQNAYDHGQLSYTSDTVFSNYIGWYSDENGNYLDFWHEGLDTANAPSGATHVVKSYGFLGETDAAHGISNTDMLYASVRVSKELNDYDNDGIAGETMLVWQIPASLIPTITYQVSVNVTSEGQITDVTNVKLESQNVRPIRLLYEVALREDIKDWNIAEKVSADYRNGTANKDAGYVFYTNQWSKTGHPSETDRNTYSHFEPSSQNERYYYTENTPIYTDQNGTLYIGASKPANATFYRAFKVYEKMDSGAFRIHTHYERISEAALAEAVQVNGSWVIPKGLIHRYLDDFYVGKGSNDTATMGYSNYPSVVYTNEHYYSYSTLGNNGKLTVTPATGIKVTKTLSEEVPGANDQFNFQIAGPAGTATLVRLDSAGNEASRQSIDTANGSFTLNAGETVYIIGLTDGATYTVKEQAHEDYNLVSVNGSTDSKQAVITAVAQTIQSAEFVNGPKGYGNLYITKEIVSDHNIPANIQAETFAVTAAMDGLDGQAFQVISSKGSDTQMTVTNGVLELTIHRNEILEIVGLPEGTEVTVTEQLTPEQSYFASTIKTRDHTGADQEDNNVAVINRNGNATAVITNTYTPAKTSAALDVEVTKHLDAVIAPGEELSFQFAVEQRVGDQWLPLTGKTGSVTMSANGEQSVTIADVLAGIAYTTVGSYAYQVREVIPEGDQRPEGVTYDRTLHTFTVTVTDENGQLKAAITDHTGAPVADSYAVDFSNTYHTAPANMDVKKTVTNLSGNPQISAANFGFTLADALVDAENNWSEKSADDKVTEVTDAAGEARFAKVYSTPGTYHYILRENIPADAKEVKEGQYVGMYYHEDKAGWYWNPAVYYVQVVVTEQPSGQLTAVVQTSTDKVNFTGTEDNVTLNYTNIYDPADAAINLNTAVKKQLEGRALQPNEFTFYVTADGDASNILLTGTNDADGNVTFDKALTLSTIGEHKFDIVELVPTETKGVTYDTTVYDLVVEVEDAGGTLTAQYYFEDSVTKTVTFHNSYRAADKQWTLTGTKELTGRDILNAEFRFDLVQVTDATGTQEAQDGLQLTAENAPADSTGRKAAFAFPAITYTHEDIGKTYYYRITEVNGGQTVLGVRHDDSAFVAVVEITDNGDGTLGVSHGIEGGNPLVFYNSYIPQAASYQLHGLKHLEGRALKDKEFSFQAYGTDSTYQIKAENLLETVTNDAEGLFSFQQITYYSTGDYYYVVTEVQGDAGGVTYDRSQYRIHVQVTDDGNGQLKATPEITLVQEETSLPASSIVFQNIYQVDDEVSIPVGGKKVLEGRALAKGEFKFLLRLTDGEFVPLEGYEPVEAVNEADGSFYFGELMTTEPGIYYLTITEDASAQAAGITYDTTVYRMTIEVKDNGEGGLDCTTKLTAAGKDVEEILFTNVFTENSGEAPVIPAPEPITPDTGDDAQLLLWTLLLIGSAVAATALVIVGKKKR